MGLLIYSDIVWLAGYPQALLRETGESTIISSTRVAVPPVGGCRFERSLTTEYSPVKIFLKFRRENNLVHLSFLLGWRLVDSFVGEWNLRIKIPVRDSLKQIVFAAGNPARERNLHIADRGVEPQSVLADRPFVVAEMWRGRKHIIVYKGLLSLLENYKTYI
ncbi:MAG: hypothetical protein NTY66_01525 [Candidatus Vogelbacteria bacterium]|nr:hypothetical protein [Candidatus Vogelbacteria bacterium]